jgi:LmbE family N-acetylglucosaminyl deacetylase
MEALAELVGADDRRVEFCGLRDNEHYNFTEVGEALHCVLPKRIDHVWAPALENGGHHQHNLVAQAATLMFQPDHITRYLTYTPLGKSRSNCASPITDSSFIRKKLRALSCYQTQIDNPNLGCWPHFAADLFEYFL